MPSGGGVHGDAGETGASGGSGIDRLVFVAGEFVGDGSRLMVWENDIYGSR